MSFPKVLSRVTNHKTPKYQLYQPGFNETNSCWLLGRWVTLSKEEWQRRRQEHEKMYGKALGAIKKQHYKDPGTAVKDMTPAQRQAWEYYSGTATISCIVNGYHQPIGIELGGGRITKHSIDWMRKEGYKAIPLVTDRWAQERGEGPTDQLKGLDIPKDLVADCKEPVDTHAMTVSQNKAQSREMSDGLLSEIDNEQYAGVSDMMKGVVVHELLEMEEEIIRHEWDVKCGKPDPYTDIKEVTANYAARRAQLKKEMPDFESVYASAKADANQCARTNLDNSQGLIYCYVLPVFHEDGTHEPWGEHDVPWARK